jgi:hypothetical protein
MVCDTVSLLIKQAKCFVKPRDCVFEPTYQHTSLTKPSFLVSGKWPDGIMSIERSGRYGAGVPPFLVVWIDYATALLFTFCVQLLAAIRGRGIERF